MTARSGFWWVLATSDTEIAGLNPTQVVEVSLRLPVYAMVLRRADPPSKESYLPSKNKIQKPQKEMAWILQETYTNKEIKE